MKKTWVRIYAFIAVIILFGALTRFAVVLTHDFNTNQELARQSFLRFAQSVRSLYATNPQAFFEAKTAEELERTVDAIESIRAFTIVAQNETQFYWSQQADLLLVDESKRNVQIVPARFFRTFQTTFPAEELSTTVVLTANSLILPADIIFLRMKPVLFIAVMLFLLTILFLLMASLYSNEQKRVEPIRVAVPTEEAPPIEYVEPEQHDVDYNESPAMHMSENQARPRVDRTDFSSLDDLRILKRNSVNADSISVDESEDTLSAAQDKSEASAETAIDETDHSFLPRLHQELLRAKDFSESLSLMLIRFEDLNNASADQKNLTAKIATRLLELCQNHDFLFEFEDSVFALIIPRMSLDMAMNAARELYPDLKKIMAFADLDGVIAVGISTCSNRDASEMTLLQEATKALDKAHRAEYPVIAYNPLRPQS